MPREAQDLNRNQKLLAFHQAAVKYYQAIELRKKAERKGLDADGYIDDDALKRARLSKKPLKLREVRELESEVRELAIAARCPFEPDENLR